MRPRYETKGDLIVEDSARQKMEALWRCRLEKLPISYEVDFLAMREGSDSVLAWIEYKRRKFVWGQYPNTRDDGDIEPVVMIPVARFIRLR
jgi:hypothetical protein